MGIMLEDILARWGEIGAFAGLAIFIIYYFIRAMERKDAQIERMTERFTSEIAKHRDVITALTIELQRDRRT